MTHRALSSDSPQLRRIVAMPSASSRSPPITDCSVRRPDGDERCQLGRLGLRHDEVMIADQLDQLVGRGSSFSATPQASPVLLRILICCAGWANADPAFPEAHSVRSLLPS